MKEIILNGQSIGWGHLEDIKQQYPGASILPLPYQISVITKKDDRDKPKNN